MQVRQAIVFLAISAAACGPGFSDFSDRIGDTKYTYWHNGSKSNSLSPRTECGPKCPSIEENIVRLAWNEHVIAARRQVVNYYHCDEDYVVSQHLNLYEQYVIVLESNDLIGPMSVAQYEDFRRQNPALLDGLELLDENNNFNGNGLRYGDLRGCTNPVPS